MNILYVAMQHEYGDPSRGLSFEENNFRSSLEGMGHKISAFDFLGRAKRDGLQQMRSDLIDLAAETKPELAFFVLFTHQLDTQTIEGEAVRVAVRRSTGLRTTTGASRTLRGIWRRHSTSP